MLVKWCEASCEVMTCESLIKHLEARKFLLMEEKDEARVPYGEM